MSRIHDDQVHHQNIDKLLYEPQGQPWSQYLRNELGHLAQINDSGVRSTYAMEFTHRQYVPKESYL